MCVHTAYTYLILGYDRIGAVPLVAWCVPSADRERALTPRDARQELQGACFADLTGGGAD